MPGRARVHLWGGLVAVAATCVAAAVLVVGPQEAGALGFPTVNPYNVPAPPAANFTFRFPPVCTTKPTGLACEQDAIYQLDVARRDLGIPAYRLPEGFPAYPPIEQTFILSNLDRALYGEPLLAGVNDTLDAWSAAVAPWAPGTDPYPESSYVDGVQWYAYGGNAAAGFPNALFAYGAWMYDDGWGGTNIDCPSPGAPGCWVHRDNVLGNYRVCVNGADDGFCTGGFWAYLADLSYGAAHGTTSSGQTADDQLFVGSPAALSDLYTWGEAVAAGAGTHLFRVPSSVALRRQADQVVDGARGQVERVTLAATLSPPPAAPASVRFAGAATACGTVHVHRLSGLALCTLRLPAGSKERQAVAVFAGNGFVTPSRSNPVTVGGP